MVLAKERDDDLETVRKLNRIKKKPSATQLVKLSPRLKVFAKIFNELFISTDDVLVSNSERDTQHVATIVPKYIVKRIINFL